LRSFQESLGKFAARNVRVVAISVDPPDTSRNLAEKQGYTFPILADEKLEVIKRLDLLHSGGFRGQDIARSAEFLLDPKGVVRWVNLTENYKLRATAEQVLKVLDDLGQGREKP
jgi:peroxiredoxin